MQQANSDKNYEVQITKIDSNKKNTTQTQTLSLLADFFFTYPSTA